MDVVGLAGVQRQQADCSTRSAVVVSLFLPWSFGSAHGLDGGVDEVDDRLGL